MTEETKETEQKTEKKILLVEDDPFLSSLLRNRLQKEGFSVILCRDGEEAVMALNDSTDVNLILLDIILPKKSGFEVMEEIRNNPQLSHSNIPIVVISNLGQEKDIAFGYQLGAAEYLIKAKISIDDLVARAKEIAEKGVKEVNFES